MLHRRPRLSCLRPDLRLPRRRTLSSSPTPGRTSPTSASPVEPSCDAGAGEEEQATLERPPRQAPRIARAREEEPTAAPAWRT
nr:unnamed protein product [Digitaria exilis]